MNVKVQNANVDRGVVSPSGSYGRISDQEETAQRFEGIRVEMVAAEAKIQHRRMRPQTWQTGGEHSHQMYAN